MHRGRARGRGRNRASRGQPATSASYVDPAVRAFKQSHAGLRSYGQHQVPPYCERVQWPAKPVGVNNFAGRQPLPDRCRVATLSAADTREKGPNGAATGECFQLDRRSANQTQPVLPTLFMPGFPKCASTWLFECMHNAFVPEMVCPEPSARSLYSTWRSRAPVGQPFDPHLWSRKGCRGRRFMLPGIA